VADVFTRALWQLAQYLSSVARSSTGELVELEGSPLRTSVCDAAEAPHTAQNASTAANRKDANFINLLRLQERRHQISTLDWWDRKRKGRSEDRPLRRYLPALPTPPALDL
jgi:hypothetical protein